jgi:hypothetical protein
MFLFFTMHYFYTTVCVLGQTRNLRPVPSGFARNTAGKNSSKANLIFLKSSLNQRRLFLSVRVLRRIFFSFSPG